MDEYPTLEWQHVLHLMTPASRGLSTCRSSSGRASVPMRSWSERKRLPPLTERPASPEGHRSQPQSVLSTGVVARRRQEPHRLDPLRHAQGDRLASFGKLDKEPFRKPSIQVLGREQRRDGKALAAELAGPPPATTQEPPETHCKAQAVASLQRFFFEELKGCGDVNAAAASALRRLADEGSSDVRPAAASPSEATSAGDD
ncbi:hypothetical protein AK812_SmicGene12915 [Symbiodinium microadriaticum]|uniref:Uncharacterized protein n=1 Tax=Symbiodinium microadriaticum TaxID=2951 RepID=A0A1Q9E9I7_SYMMI|nr:hypothetical protein AK812_SmicGene12915 [Symbiodinium microadriaticum]